MIERLATAIAALSELERRRWYGVGLCAILYLFHVFWFSSWLIEDAAISIAYAHNLAHGEGLVTNAGGGWVEGFSNPTWTLLLSLTSLLGLSPWVMVKVLGTLFGLLTLPLAYLWARRTAPDAPGMWPVLAPLGLAMSTPFALWSVAGLENGLFNLLLAAGALGVLRDGDRPSTGLSGLFLGLLAFTRPEAPLYAGLITAIAAPKALRAGGLRWLAGFFLASAGPFLTWHAWRYWAFAWPFPNTYYAKQTAGKFNPFDWNHTGWVYLRRWSLWSAHAPMLPLFTFGQAGVRGARGAATMVITGILLGVLIPGLTVVSWVITVPEEPTWLVAIRVGVIVAAAVALPCIGWARTGQTERAMAWGAAACAMFFAVFTGGDWMRGARWMSMASVPLAVLLADAARTLGPVLAELLTRLSRRATIEIATGLVAAPLLLAGVVQTVDFLFGIETTPFDVRRRVLYMQGVAERLDLEHVSLLDVDMGAHMVWSGFEMIDLAGLCDVPYAHHHHSRGFIDTYVAEENPPTFAHLHGGWANRSGIPRRPWFRRQYLEIPGYGHSRSKFHIGNHIRRDLLVRAAWTGSTERRTPFGPLILEGLEFPSPVVHAGGRLQVELGWSITRQPPGFRALFFLTDGKRIVVKDLPPAYDWIPVSRWRKNKVFLGRYALALPDDLDPGKWTVGLAVVSDGPKAVTLPAQTSTQSLPLFMAGEAVWTNAITIASPEQTRAVADERVQEAEGSANAGRCEEAERRWHRARHHLASDDPWQASARSQVHASLGRCWATRALDTLDVTAIHTARRYDHHDPLVGRVSTTLADLWQAEGDLAHRQGDEEATWTGWSKAIRADPARSWLRRRLEELRAVRLAKEEK